MRADDWKPLAVTVRCPECSHGIAWHDAQGCAHGFCECALTQGDFPQD